MSVCNSGRLFVLLFVLAGQLCGHQALSLPQTDSLPAVFNDQTDVLHSFYRYRAAVSAKQHQVPGNLRDWESYRRTLRENIIHHTGTKFFPDLPLDLRETASHRGNGFTVKNIWFQTRPQVYATANLYVPEGSGKFPAVIVMMGHSTNGKLYENYQLVGQTLAKEGYVALCIDPWGAGERSTRHDDFEYHGTYLGASLLNVGETLMGMQLTDNIRGIDLLQSLPFVDRDRIGATGASGGGNQTMWLAALDERVKAALPVVSVGTFDSYVMGHNCVCEVLPHGLTFTGEWGVLGLVAPRALRMCNHKQESNPTFFPAEMLKSYEKALPVFGFYGAEKNIDYQLFDRPHGYYPEDREALLGLMDLHLKGVGDGKPRKEKSLEPLPAEQLMVFEKGKRDPLVHSTASFNRMMGEQLRKTHLDNPSPDIALKRKELAQVLSLKKSGLGTVKLLGQHAGWERVMLTTNEGRVIPVLVKDGRTREFALVAHPLGKKHIPLSVIESIKKSGMGIVVVDFSGTGEAASFQSAGYDNLGRMHTYSRAALWVGETVPGNWVTELNCLASWLKSEKQAVSLSFHGYREAGLAGILFMAMGGELKEIHTYQSPVSYQFDRKEGLEFFGLGIHLPGILNWGDVSLAASLGTGDVHLHEPVTMSGTPLSSAQKTEAVNEFESVKKKTGTSGKIIFD